ncbi:hypothetical protein N9B73_03100, partial [Verrucomicrobiales bacterium]|nr:hypothetical protein [Verrucomicrobiales bacterium]
RFEKALLQPPDDGNTIMVPGGKVWNLRKGTVSHPSSGKNIEKSGLRKRSVNCSARASERRLL